MGKKIRITRKRLKEDEVASFWVDTYYWARDNQKAIVIGAIALLALFVLFSAMGRRRESRRSQASRLIGEAQRAIQDGLFAQDEEIRQELKQMGFNMQSRLK